ncbi:cytochrome-c peroxidase [Dyadobacter luticola]|uniref:Cytochrome-c peroxidase n=1 Tax=Dyadobacter luticola TaxID=1979387 RepID=A0A5R9L6F6_9BACT|nr:cytochrome c peroxidase [Dyadobacter luticola]TLV03927.1 cytochrome-c peroxidase [Dyadobacter luticola]
MSAPFKGNFVLITRHFTNALAALFLIFFGLACQKDQEPVEPVSTGPTPIAWTKPKHFPDPVYDMSRNPLTEEGVELGRFLFYDGILSRTNQIGCGTCHQQEAAFTHHGHELSHGVDDLLGTRNSPAVQNMAWNTSFFWDGGVHDLDLLPFNPIQNPVEMDETVKNVITKLQATPLPTAKKAVDYPQMFKKAFGTEEITSERMMKALSQFMLTMVSAESRYDYYKMGDQSALNADEKQGMALFQAKCSSCHAGELFTDYSFRNNGLVPLRIDDKGRFGISANNADLYKFKVPSLRNVGLTAPYMHDGRFHTLEEVLDHYSDSIKPSATLDSVFIRQGEKPGITLSDAEKKSIIAFLRSLNDEQFIRNAKLSDPGVGTNF